MKRILSRIARGLVVSGFLLLVGGSANAQLSLRSFQFRAKYGEPQLIQLKDNRPQLERYLVRSKISMTVKYTQEGLACEAIIEPVPGSTPPAGASERPPEGDYMATAEVIEVLNELVPVDIRGRKTEEMMVNGGDRKMRLHHPGCSGFYFAQYENVSFNAATWCGGGTFSATVHFGTASCKGSITIKKQESNHPR